MTVNFPRIGLGTWKYDETPDAVDLIRHAVRVGYRLIDSAEAYGTESQVGEAVASMIETGEIRRDEIFLQSKCTIAAGYHETLASVERCLNRFRADYIDSYLIHQPVARGYEDRYRKPMVESWRALEDSHRRGKIRCLGLSNFLERHIGYWIDDARVKPAFHQLELHPAYQQRGLVRSSREWGMVTQAWSPLGRDLTAHETIKTAAARNRTPPPQGDGSADITPLRRRA